MSSNSSSSSTWNSRYQNPLIPHDANYYAKCAVGGIISCGSTHTAVLPLDIVKIRMQVNPQEYKGLVQGLGTLVKNEGFKPSVLFRSAGATSIGYGLQGMNKFGFYEVFKDFYSNLAGEQIATQYKGAVWLAASASAEAIADVFLTPFEMIKVKQQQSKQGTFPFNFGGAWKEVTANPAQHSWPFGSLTAVWSRQIPYTMAKFYFFELVVNMFYTHVFTKQRSEYSKSTQLGITFASGYIAGILCAIVSQVPDSLVSLRGKQENAGKSFGQITKEVGVSKLMMSGLGTRIVMIGTLTGLQWYIYDGFKVMTGISPASAPAAANKASEKK